MENADQPLQPEENPLIFSNHPGGVLRHECKAWLPQGMLGPKPRGFIHDHADHVFEASPERARLRIGRRGALPRCLSGGELPLEVTIRLSKIGDADGHTRQVTVDIRSLVRFVQPDEYRARCTHVVRSLRHSFMAQDLVEKPGKYVFADEE